MIGSHGTRRGLVATDGYRATNSSTNATPTANGSTGTELDDPFADEVLTALAGMVVVRRQGGVYSLHGNGPHARRYAPLIKATASPDALALLLPEVGDYARWPQIEALGDRLRAAGVSRVWCRVFPGDTCLSCSPGGLDAVLDVAGSVSR